MDEKKITVRWKGSFNLKRFYSRMRGIPLLGTKQILTVLAMIYLINSENNE